MSPVGLRISAWAATDVGLVREGNEDNYYAGGSVFAVADGMGGHVAGEIASSKALEPLRDVDGTHFGTAEDAQEALVEAITAANQVVIAQGDADPSLSGMGTTLTAVLLRSGRLHLAHVGDSRAYLLRPGERISQLTTDHTLVEQLVREGRISREQAATHPQRSVITRAIGVDRHVDVDSFPPLELQPGDQVLLCSDGLTGPVSDERISAVLAEREDGEEACRALIAAAKDGGAPDNVTVVLLRVGDRGSAGTARTAAPVVDDRVPTGPLPLPAAAGDGSSTANGHQPPRGDRDVERPAPSPPEEQPRRRGRRVLAVLVVLLLLLGVAAAGGYALLSRTYFVGEDDGQVAVYNGLPQSIFGLPLYWLLETSDLATGDLTTLQARRVEAGVTAESLDDARQTIENYREAAPATSPRGRTGTASPSPSSRPSPTPTDTASPEADTAGAP